MIFNGFSCIKSASTSFHGSNAVNSAVTAGAVFTVNFPKQFLPSVVSRSRVE